MKLTSTKFAGHKRKSFQSTFLSGVVAACLFTSSLTASVQTAHAADPVMKIGVLDEVKLGEGYTKYRNDMEDLQKRIQAVRIQVGARRYLSPTEGTRFDELFKKTRSTAEETELQGFVKIGSDRNASYIAFSGQEKLDDTQKKQFKDMQDYQIANGKIADELEFIGLRPLGTLVDDTDKKYIDNANAMVQKVAADQKLTVLLRKDAIVWSTPTVDITDLVLKNLNAQQ